MKSFISKAFTLLMICSLPSLKASCPTVCPTGGAQFCALNSQTLCVTGNAQIGGNLTVCGTGSAMVSISGGAGVTGPVPFGSLAAYGNVYSTALGLVLVSGTNPIPFATNGPLLNVSHTATSATVTPAISGVYLITYVIEPTVDIGVGGVYTITVGGAPVASSTYASLAGQINFPATGQAIVAITAGTAVQVTLTSTSTVTLTGTASLTLEKIA